MEMTEFVRLRWPGAATLVGAAAVLVPLGAALAQHATAFDVEDGARAYETWCAACHGPDGNLIAGIDFSRGRLRRDMTDTEIAATIINGVPGTPMPATAGMSEEQALQIVAYLRSMPDMLSETGASGDPVRGRALVHAPDGCLGCHRIAAEGGRSGPALSDIGALRRATEIERSLLDPQAEIQPNHRFVGLRTLAGEEITGRLLNHDSFHVQLLDDNERLRLLRREDLAEFGFIESPMPSYRDEFDAQELADVVSYLVTLTGE